MALALAVGSGLLEVAAQAAVIAGALLLVGMVVALGAFAYKSLAGDGITWPDETEEEEGVTRSDDDEWKYS